MGVPIRTAAALNTKGVGGISGIHVGMSVKIHISIVLIRTIIVRDVLVLKMKKVSTDVAINVGKVDKNDGTEGTKKGTKNFLRIGIVIEAVSVTNEDFGLTSIGGVGEDKNFYVSEKGICIYKDIVPALVRNVWKEEVKDIQKEENIIVNYIRRLEEKVGNHGLYFFDTGI